APIPISQGSGQIKSSQAKSTGHHAFFKTRSILASKFSGSGNGTANAGGGSSSSAQSGVSSAGSSTSSGFFSLRRAVTGTHLARTNKKADSSTNSVPPSQEFEQLGGSLGRHSGMLVRATDHPGWSRSGSGHDEDEDDDDEEFTDLSPELFAVPNPPVRAHPRPLVHFPNLGGRRLAGVSSRHGVGELGEAEEAAGLTDQETDEFNEADTVSRSTVATGTTAASDDSGSLRERIAVSSCDLLPVRRHVVWASSEMAHTPGKRAKGRIEQPTAKKSQPRLLKQLSKVMLVNRNKHSAPPPADSSPS
ncbi:unnamed protein product, partial [Protopolystoma xenopodis]